MLDENLTPRLGVLLRNRGHVAHDVKGSPLQGANDPTVLLEAAQAGLTVVTQDRLGFTDLHLAWIIWPVAWRTFPTPVHQGILTVAQLPAMRAAEVADALNEFLATGRSATNALFDWRPVRGWEQLRR